MRNDLDNKSYQEVNHEIRLNILEEKVKSIITTLKIFLFAPVFGCFGYLLVNNPALKDGACVLVQSICSIHVWPIDNGPT